MRFRLLGPTEVWAGSTQVPVGPPRQCAVLAVLAADAGRVVPVDVLVDRVWGDDPPERVRRTLHTHIARVRRLVEEVDAAGPGSARLVHRAGGYLLDVDADQVDVHRFHRLVEQARERAGGDWPRVALLREALGLWRGRPLVGVSGEWAERMRRSWQRQHGDAVVAWAELEVRVGNAAAVVGPVSELVEEYPLVEPLAAVLMRTLAALGRTSEALQVYAAARRRLGEELGVDPAAELQAVHQAVLRGQLGQPSAAGGPSPSPRARPVPAQLPADVPVFTGRSEQLEQLDSVLTGLDGPAPTLVTCVVEGMAGVGKPNPGK